MPQKVYTNNPLIPVVKNPQKYGKWCVRQVGGDQDKMSVFKQSSSSCKICGRRFNRRSNLKRHITLHFVDRPHKCSTCSKSYRTLCNLKSHMRTHLKPKSLHCRYCGKFYIKAKFLLKHEEFHIKCGDKMSPEYVEIFREEKKKYGELKQKNIERLKLLKRPSKKTRITSKPKRSTHVRNVENELNSSELTSSSSSKKSNGMNSTQTQKQFDDMLFEDTMKNSNIISQEQSLPPNACESLSFEIPSYISVIMNQYAQQHMLSQQQLIALQQQVISLQAEKAARYQLIPNLSIRDQAIPDQVIRDHAIRDAANQDQVIHPRIIRDHTVRHQSVQDISMEDINNEYQNVESQPAGFVLPE